MDLIRQVRAEAHRARVRPRRQRLEHDPRRPPVGTAQRVRECADKAEQGSLPVVGEPDQVQVEQRPKSRVRRVEGVRRDRPVVRMVREGRHAELIQCAEVGRERLMGRAADLRELSRPVRRRSHYPTLLALVNSLQKLFEMQQESENMAEYLVRELEEIREHAKRERFNRQR